MKRYRYVTLDPTGNITCLVTDPVDPADEAEVTRKLLEQCEQAAYLHPARRPEAAAGIRLMGGEFCGNAAMGAAAWLVREGIAPGEEKTLLLEVSGAADPVRCSVRKTADGFEGTVDMPGIPEIREENFFGIPFTMIRTEGIVHLISSDHTFEKGEAEALLTDIAGRLPDKAVGLLQWSGRTRYMLPLVFVRGSGSLVWEHGCGSGSAAVGAAEAFRSGEDKTVSVSQPGGTICAKARVENGAVTEVTITGQVRFGAENTIQV